MRVDAVEKPGGDLQQILAYIRAGQRVEIDGHAAFEGEILTNIAADFSDFDIVHLTNLDRPVELFSYFKSAKAAGKPTILSAIHHSYKEIQLYERQGRAGAIGKITGHFNFQHLELSRSFVRSISYPRLTAPTCKILPRGLSQAQREVLTGVDLVLVLTEKEKADIINDFDLVQNARFLCIRNGYENVDGECPVEDVPLRNIDVCVVGRIEARKNQIRILDALEKLELSGVFIGSENLHHKAYCRAFLSRINSSRSRYLGGCSHSETIAYMRQSKVHVSASWFEVSSLVDIEAYIAGCAVVASKCGGTNELLGGLAEYVNPYDSKDIERAISTAFARSDFPEIGRDSVSIPSWDYVGKCLLGTYINLLRSQRTSVERIRADECA